MARQALPLRAQANAVAALLPSAHWCRAAERISRLHGAVAARAGGNGPLTRALMFDHWLRELTLHGPFPIPWRNAEDAALRRSEPGRGILFCWSHMPLVEIPLRAVMELRLEPPLMVADPGKIVGRNEFVAPGMARRVEAIAAGPGVLNRVRTALRDGRSVAWLADAALGGPLSSQVLRVAGLAEARLIFQWAERDPDGTIAVRFLDPPRPDCESDEAVEENLAVLRRQRRRILGALGMEVEQMEG